MHAGVELLISRSTVSSTELEVLGARLGRGFNVLCAPVGILRACVEDYVRHYRFPPLYVCGNASLVLGKLRKNVHVRRGFTVYQVREILLDAYEDVVFVEHDPSLGEVDFWTLEDFAFLPRQVGRERTLVYLAPSLDRDVEVLARFADKLVVVDEVPGGFRVTELRGGVVAQHYRPKDPYQLTLEVS